MISLVLGVVVVLFAGLFAYNYFRSQREIVPTSSTEVKIGSQTKVQQDQNNQDNDEKIDQGVNAVALPTVHVVSEGENLWTISEKYYKSGFNFVDIVKINGLANAGQIVAGQKLTIPKVAVKLPVTIAGATAPVVTNSRIDGTSYTIQKGDTVWEIAVRAYGDGFQFVKIVKANNLVNPNLIHSGNVLRIPR